MQTELLDSYESAIRRISKSHSPKGTVDVLAMDRDDYESALRVESIRLQLEFRERHGFNVNAEQRYVWKGLWNASAGLARQRARHVRGLMRLAATEPPVDETKRDVEERYEQREAISMLKVGLGDGYNILHRAAQFTTLTQSWDEETHSYRSYRRVIARLREQAREILKN